ncbi:MAG: hypothetical protein ABI992_08945 [Chthoniobacterales bacterium]
MKLRFCLIALLGVGLLVRAQAQDPDIDRLLKKLPAPEKLVKPQITFRGAASDPAMRDPVTQQLMQNLASGKAAEGAKAARQLAARYPNSPVANFLNGMSAAATQNNDTAVSALQKSVALAPQWADAHFALGLAEGRRGHFAAALPQLQKSTQLAPRQALAYLYLSACCERLGRKEDSARAARRATALAPNAAAAWAQLARAEGLLGNRAESLLAAGKAVRLSPNIAPMISTPVVGGLDVNRPIESIRTLERAVKLEPKNSLLRKQLRDFQILATNARQAVIRLQANTASHPNSGAAWFQLGLAYQRLERRREASAAFANAKRLLPGNAATRAAIAKPGSARTR